MPDTGVIGWDVGGAHLKAARIDSGGVLQGVLQLPCPLWQGMDKLHTAMDEALARTGAVPAHAITMTGEMTDLFADRGNGVLAITQAMNERLGGGTQLQFYAGDRGFIDAADTSLHAHAVASANWQATARFVAARMGDALLVDVGSTTTDVVLIAGGAVCTLGRDDARRLEEDELLYCGVVRTPLMALAPRAPFDGKWIPLMAEHFATTADAYRLIGLLPPDADQHATADGGEKTADASARRLARMIGRDAATAPLLAWRRLAGWFAQRQLLQIADACARVLSRTLLDDKAPLVGAGCGRFLVAQLAQRMGRPYRDFASLVPSSHVDSEWIATCAPAVAVAFLLQEGAR